MITIFNRRELVWTSSMAEQARVSAALDAAGIDYRIKVRNLLARNGGGGRGGVPGVRMDAAYEYIVYVDKKDWELAQHMI